MRKRARWEQGSLFEGAPAKATPGPRKREREGSAGTPTAPPAPRQGRAKARRKTEEPSTGAAGKAAYRFRVALMWKKSVWRIIELRADQTLHDLHGAIQEAFDWDDDHLYSFFMSGKRWDPSTEYASPFADEGRKAHQVKIDALRLKPTQRFLYLFDYGDELMHEVRLMGVAPVVARQRYPRIVESHGKAPPQYPDAEEE